MTSVNFSLSVGTVVPSSVRIHPLPDTVVAIVPQYRGYDYIVVRDDIVILEPRTRKIVTVITNTGNTASTTTTRRVSLSDQDRAAIRKSHRATTGSATRVKKMTVGERIPDDVELRTFETEVVHTVPAVREYRYIDRANGGVYVVDPTARTIIEEID
ncbi:MAG: DUF1236 domain-containing protein [Pseudolabrys sp.]|nr:DUF1236 domain-containing protein [Pseudolabrys sp.]MBV9956011.1 DUF1236 domain-containing protein [Pseudolabrys sp.]